MSNSNSGSPNASPDSVQFYEVTTSHSELCLLAFLGRVGVQLICHQRGTLRCKGCGGIWSPNNRNGKFPKGYWRCPFRACNAKTGGRS